LSTIERYQWTDISNHQSSINNFNKNEPSAIEKLLDRVEFGAENVIKIWQPQPNRNLKKTHNFTDTVFILYLFLKNPSGHQ
jgi:hypothetical protein